MIFTAKKDFPVMTLLGKPNKKLLNKLRYKELKQEILKHGIEWDYEFDDPIRYTPSHGRSQLFLPNWLSFQLDVMGKTDEWVIQHALGRIKEFKRKQQFLLDKEAALKLQDTQTLDIEESLKKQQLSIDK